MKEEKLLGTRAFKSGALYDMDEPQPMEQPEQPERQLSNRIGAAIRRENEMVEEEDMIQNISESPSEMVDVTERVESIIDRMTWTSNTTSYGAPTT